jgi:hypothetical protein
LRQPVTAQRSCQGKRGAAAQYRAAPTCRQQPEWGSGRAVPAPSPDLA